MSQFLKTTNHPKSQIPAMMLTILFGILTLIVWPGFLEHFLSLNWKVGNMRPLAYGLQLFSAILTTIVFLKREWINSYFSSKFPSRKEVIFTMIGFMITLSVTLFVMELGLRALNLPYQTSWEPNEYRRTQFDSEIGWTYIPNKSVRQRFIGGQPEIAVYTDGHGSRVNAPGIRRHKSVPTTLFIGCSLTFGFGVPYEETFVGRLEKHPEFNGQVVNLGVEAYGTDQALLLLERHFSRYNTKVVVYTFHGDHINRNHNYDRRLLFRNARFVGTKPLFSVNHSKALHLKKKPARYEDLKELRIMALLKFFWTKFGPELSPDLTIALIKEMKDFVESRGASFVLVYWRDEDKNKILYSALKGLACPLVDTAENPPPGWGEWNGEWKLPGDMHPSPQAHSRAANLIFKELKRLALVSDNKK